MNFTPARTRRDSSSKAVASEASSNLGLLASVQNEQRGKLERSWRVFSGPWLPPFLLGAMVAAYIVFTLRLVFHLYDTMSFQAGGDLAIFDQAAWLISQGKTPFVSVRGVHILSDHFSAIIYLLAPFYWIWDSPKLLLLMQTLALAVGAVSVSALARERLESAWWGVLFAGTYLLYPVVQWANSYEFHPDTFIVPFLLTAFWALRQRRWVLYFGCLLGAALTKEHVGPTVCALGVWVWWSVDRRIGRLTLGSGFLFMALALGTVRFFNNGTPSAYYLLYEKYGSDLPGMVTGVLKQPGLVWADVTSDSGREYLGDLLSPLMGLPLLSPSLLLVALPALATNLLSSRTIMHQLGGGYYSALLVPLLFAGSIESCRRLQKFLGPRNMAIVGANLVLWSLMSAPRGALWEQNHAIASDSADKLRTNRERMLSVREIRRLVPVRASMSAQVGLTPYLNRRTDLYTFPNPFLQRAWGNTLKARREIEFFGGYIKRPPRLQSDVDAAPVEYVALCPGTQPWPLTESNLEDYTLALFKSPSYGIVFIDQHTVLLRRRANRHDGWRRLAKISGARVASEKDVETAFWKWLSH